MKTARTDRSGNAIGDGTWNNDPVIYSFPEFSQITTSISESATSESTYIRYFNNENGKSITVRFSNHENNAVKFGDQLDGNCATKDEVLFHMGLKIRIFIPDTYLSIWNRKVSKKELSSFEMIELTMTELYALGKGTDISKFTGKLAKDSNYLILGTQIEEHILTGLNFLGQATQRGKFIYKDI